MAPGLKLDSRGRRAAAAGHDSKPWQPEEGRATARAAAALLKVKPLVLAHAISPFTQRTERPRPATSERSRMGRRSPEFSSSVALEIVMAADIAHVERQFEVARAANADARAELRTAQRAVGTSKKQAASSVVDASAAWASAAEAKTSHAAAVKALERATHLEAKSLVRLGKTEDALRQEEHAATAAAWSEASGMASGLRGRHESRGWRDRLEAARIDVAEAREEAEAAAQATTSKRDACEEAAARLRQRDAAAAEAQAKAVKARAAYSLASRRRASSSERAAAAERAAQEAEQQRSRSEHQRRRAGGGGASVREGACPGCFRSLQSGSRGVEMYADPELEVVMSRRRCCKHPGCTADASYGPIGTRGGRHAILCADHADLNMYEDVVHKDRRTHCAPTRRGGLSSRGGAATARAGERCGAAANVRLKSHAISARSSETIATSAIALGHGSSRAALRFINGGGGSSLDSEVESVVKASGIGPGCITWRDAEVRVLIERREQRRVEIYAVNELLMKALAGSNDP